MGNQVSNDELSEFTPEQESHFKGLISLVYGDSASDIKYDVTFNIASQLINHHDKWQLLKLRHVAAEQEFKQLVSLKSQVVSTDINSTLIKSLNIKSKQINKLEQQIDNCQLTYSEFVCNIKSTGPIVLLKLDDRNIFKKIRFELNYLSQCISV